MDFDTRSKFSESYKWILSLSLIINLSCYLKSTKEPFTYPKISTPIENQLEWQSKLYFEKIEDFKKTPIGHKKIVFLGNSITENAGDWNEKFSSKNIVNRGISGDFTNGVLARLEEIFYYQPVAIFLLIGINDVFGINDPLVSPSYVTNKIKQITELINKNCPNTKLYIQTILPVDKEKFLKVREFYPDNIVPINDKIREINNLIKENHKGFNHFIDLHKYYLNDYQVANPELFKDGLHLSEKGYALWTEIINDEVLKHTTH